MIKWRIQDKKLQFTSNFARLLIYIKRLKKSGTIKQYRKGEMIYFHMKILPDKFYLIKSGRVRLFFTSKEGNELTLEILGVNQIFGK